jgi:hypothetical protein
MRETRLSGSVEGVVSNHDPYSDFVTHSATVPHRFQGRIRRVPRPIQ